MTLTFDQIRAYFEARHPGRKLELTKASVKCIFHDDRTPSCTLFLDGAGGFHCNACAASGNVFQFEAKFSNCTLGEAEAKVAEITGAKPSARLAHLQGWGQRLPSTTTETTTTAFSSRSVATNHRAKRRPFASIGPTSKADGSRGSIHPKVHQPSAFFTTSRGLLPRTW